MPECLLTVRVTPRSARDSISAWEGDVLRVRLRALPIEGQANDALRRLLSSSLGLPLRDIELVSGSISRTKRLRIFGLDEAGVRDRLSVD